MLARPVVHAERENALTLMSPSMFFVVHGTGAARAVVVQVQLLPFGQQLYRVRRRPVGFEKSTCVMFS